MKAAKFFRFGSAVAVAALLAGSVLASEASGKTVVTSRAAIVYSGSHYAAAVKMAEAKAAMMRHELRLNERTYRKVFDFYLKEMTSSRGVMDRGFAAREEKAMHRILSKREFTLWKAGIGRGHALTAGRPHAAAAAGVHGTARGARIHGVRVR